MSRILVAVQRREKAGHGMTGNGIGLASNYVRAFEQRAGSRAKMKQFMRAHKLRDWSFIIKEAAHKLTYGTPNTGPTGGVILKRLSDKTETGDGVQVFGTPKRANANILTPKAIMDYETILTARMIDRDGDLLEPEGMDIDQKMPTLWQHLAVEPIGKYLQETERTKDVLSIANSLCGGLEMAENAAKLVEFGGLRTSHGFEPTDYETVEEMYQREGKHYHKDSAIQGGEEAVGWHVKRAKVLESSLVSIPSCEAAEITAYSRQKMTHPLFKLWTGYAFEHRTPQVTSGWDPPTQKALEMVGGIHIHLGDLVTKAKARKAPITIGESVRVRDTNEETKIVKVIENSNDPNNPILYLENGEHVLATDVEFLGMKSKAKGDELRPADETPAPDAAEDEAAPAKITASLLKAIEDDVNALCKAKGLPSEAKARCELIRGMIESVRSKLAASAKSIGKALKDMDLEGIANEHEQMAEAMHAGVKRICTELEQVLGVEGLNDGQKNLVNQVLSAAGATQEMIRAYKDGDYSDPDGMMQTGRKELTVQQGADGKFNIMDGGEVVAGPYDAETTAWADLYELQSQGVASHSLTKTEMDDLYANAPEAHLFSGEDEDDLTGYPMAEPLEDLPEALPSNAPSWDEPEENDGRYPWAEPDGTRSKAAYITPVEGGFGVYENGKLLEGPFETEEYAQQWIDMNGKAKGIYEDFEQSWPEDEAASLRDWIDSEYEQGSEEHSQQLQIQGEDAAQRLFSGEPDEAELRSRFFARLNGKDAEPESEPEQTEEEKAANKFRVSAGNGRVAVGSDDDGWRLFDVDTAMSAGEEVFATSDDAVAWSQANKSAKVAGAYEVQADVNGRWYVVGENTDGRFNADGPFGTQEEAEAARDQAMSQGGYPNAPKATKARVVEQDGAFYVETDSGELIGPYESKMDALIASQGADDEKGSEPTEDDESQPEEKAQSQLIPDSKPPQWQVVGSGGQVIDGPFDSERDAQSRASMISMGYASHKDEGDPTPAYAEGHSASEGDTNPYPAGSAEAADWDAGYADAKQQMDMGYGGSAKGVVDVTVEADVNGAWYIMHAGEVWDGPYPSKEEAQAAAAEFTK